MRLLAPIAAAVLAFSLLAPAGARADETPPASTAKKVVLEPVFLVVTDVKDDAAAAKVAAAVTAVKGVTSFAWTVERTEAKVVREQGVAGDDVLVKAVATAGFGAQTLATREVRLPFAKKLHCPACVMKVEETARAMAATKEVEVAADRTSVRVLYDTKQADEAAYRKAIGDAGYPIAE